MFPPDKNQSKVSPLDQMLFLTVVEKDKKFRISKLWLDHLDEVSPDAKEQTLDFQAFSLKPMVPLYDSDGIIDHGIKMLKKFGKEIDGWKKPCSMNQLIDFTKLTDLEATLQNDTIELPYKMYGEFAPSATALLCGRKVTVTYTEGKNDEESKEILADARRIKDFLVTFALSNPPGLNHATRDKGPFNNLHFFWRGTDIPSEFRQRMHELAAMEPKKLDVFEKLYRATSTNKTPPLNPLRVCFRVRNADSIPAKNTSPEMIDAILEELALTLCFYSKNTGQNRPYEVILLGDTGCVTASVVKKKLEEFFGHNNNNQPDISVVDLLDFPKKSGPLKDFHAKNPLPGFQDYDVEGVGDYISYLDQWLLYYYLAAEKKPVFVVGAESGNMDMLGFTGTPVISIDPKDPAEDLPVSLLIDRIGQYCCLTPLWQLVNANVSKDPSGLFREYLRGAMLRFLVSKRGDESGKSEQK